MPSPARPPSLITARARHACAALLLLLAAPWAGTVMAVDAALDWASLSGEQQYMLARFAAQWPKLDVAARRGLLARADAQRLQARNAPAANSTARPKETAVPSRAASRRRRALSAAEAALSVHSFRLRRVLRDLPGVSSEERRDVLARWATLSTTQRTLLVDRYMHNADDSEELALQRALRDGDITNADLQRGLASGKLQADDVKSALAAGAITTKSLKEGVASHDIVAEDLDKALRESKIESSELNNAIEHNLSPDAAAGGDAPAAP